jgi:hypothetical protein
MLAEYRSLRQLRMRKFLLPVTVPTTMLVPEEEHFPEWFSAPVSVGGNGLT